MEVNEGKKIQNGVGDIVDLLLFLAKSPLSRPPPHHAHNFSLRVSELISSARLEKIVPGTDLQPVINTSAWNKLG